jgi:hypothetical protein
MRKHFLIFINVSFLLSGWSQSNSKIKNTTNYQEMKIDKKKDKSHFLENTKEICSELTINTIWNYYSANELTSGRMDKPVLITNCQYNQKQHFGFYDFIDKNSKLIPAIVAKALVTFEKLPWNYFDSDQKIILLVVSDRLFKCNPFSFSVGDSVSKIDRSLTKLTILENIHYFQLGSCMVAAKENDGLIIKYIYWHCKLSEDEVKEIHKSVKNYLN